MRIHWYLPTTASDISELSKTPLASIRLRALPSIIGFEKNGFKVSFGEKYNSNERLDVAVFGKLGDPIDVPVRMDNWTAEIRKLKTEGVTIIVDYTDHHLLINSNLTKFYLDNINIADIIAVPSPQMIQSLKKITNSKIILIEDALEIEALHPRNHKNIITEILWFGAKSNLKYLVEYIEKIEYDKQLNINVLIDKKGMEWLKSTQFKNKAQISIKAQLWSVSNMVEVAKKCDFSLIPSDVNDVRKSGAGSNRLITSLALGLPVLATNLSSYESYKEYFTDIEKTSIKEMIDKLSSMQDIVIDAQVNIINKFSMENIGVKWSEIIKFQITR